MSFLAFGRVYLLMASEKFLWRERLSSEADGASEGGLEHPLMIIQTRLISTFTLPRVAFE